MDPKDFAKQIVNNAAKDGAPMIATRPVMYDGRRFEKGEQVQLMGGRWDANLIEQGFFVTIEHWQDMLAENEADTYQRNVLQPARAGQSAAEGELQSAKTHLEAAQKRLLAAEEGLELAQGAYLDAMANAPERLKARMK